MEASTRRRAWKIAAVILVLISPILYFIGWYAISNWSAERNARSLCDETMIGANVFDAVAKANARGAYVNCNADGCEFRFPIGLGFDQAYCGVSSDEHGKVRSKAWYVQYD